jgi:hypothetical protein
MAQKSNFSVPSISPFGRSATFCECFLFLVSHSEWQEKFWQTPTSLGKWLEQRKNPVFVRFHDATRANKARAMMCLRSGERAGKRDFELRGRSLTQSITQSLNLPSNPGTSSLTYCPEECLWFAWSDKHPPSDSVARETYASLHRFSITFVADKKR